MFFVTGLAIEWWIASGFLFLGNDLLFFARNLNRV